jgi:hypothetical protein
MRRNDAVTSVGDMENLSAVGRKLIDELSFLSQAFSAESDQDARALLVRKASRARTMSQHPGAGPVPLDLVVAEISAELAEAIRKLSSRGDSGKE